jgi:DNA-binding CsgD family transcriptional regulator
MKLSKIEERFREIFSSYSGFKNTDHIKKLIELDQFYPFNNTFFAIVYTQTNSYRYISKNFKSCTGLDSELMYDKGFAYFWSNFHENDVPLWMQGLDTLMKFTLTEIAVENRKNVTYTWNFRLKLGSGKYCNLIQNTTTLELDDTGKPVLGLANYTVLDGELDMDVCISAKKINDKGEYETLFFKNISNSNLLSNLSKREMDIARLLVLNKSSLEISEALFISKNTVDTHRRKILKKLSLKSTGELNVYFRRYPNLL